MRQRLFALAAAVLAALSCMPWGAAADDPGREVTILFTHDLHDHVLPQGVIRFDETGENVNSAGVLVEIRDGKHVIVYPEAYADD